MNLFADQAGILTWASGLSFAGAIVLLAGAVRSRMHPHLRRSLRALSDPSAPSFHGDLDRLFERIGRGRVGARVASRLEVSARFMRRMELAGSPWTLRGAAGRIVAAAAVGGLAVCLIGLLVPPLIALVPIGLALGARMPAILLARRARARQRRIEGQVPELVELLVAATESGLPPPTAFMRSAEALSPPLGEELSLAAAQIQLGAPWREALDAVVDRTDAPSLARLTRSLKRAHRLGASVRGSLLALVDELRTERRARAEEKARRAPVKMLFPLVFLILPAFILLTVGPVLLSTVRSLR